MNIDVQCYVYSTLNMNCMANSMESISNGWVEFENGNRKNWKAQWFDYMKNLGKNSNF